MSADVQVLFVSKQRLVGATNGSSAYLIDLARAVRAAGMIPHLVQPAPTVAGRWPVLSLRPEMKVFETHVIRGLVRVGDRFVVANPRVYLAAAWAVTAGLLRRLGGRWNWLRDRPLPYAIAIPWTKADHLFLASAAVGRADLVIADYMFTAEGLRSLPRVDVPSAIVMHDLFHARAGGGQDSVAAVTREMELEQLSRADAVIAIQVREAEFVREALPESRVIVAPMAAQAVGQPQLGENNELLFVGSNTAPNVVGLEWFFDEVWPQLRLRSPQLHLTVAGTVGRAFAKGGPDGVTFLGMVDDLAPLYTRAAVVISPLTFGSGLKIKLIEALAAGKVIVATPITMQGVETVCEGSVVCVKTGSDFASAIIKYADDPKARANLAAKALATARMNFGAAACYADFTAWLKLSAHAVQQVRTPIDA